VEAKPKRFTWDHDHGIRGRVDKKAAALGAAGLLTKPIDFGLLREEIDQRLQKAA